MLNGCGSAYEELIITVDPTLSPIVANAGIDHCLASGTVKDTLNANNPTPYPGDWNFIDGPNTPFIVDQTLYNTEVTGMINGTYRFEWTINCGCICGVTKDTVLVTIDNPVTVADAGADITLCGNSTTMAANTAAVGTGLWTQIYGNGGAIITSPTSPTTTVTSLID
jgi:hypothetical protein